MTSLEDLKQTIQESRVLTSGQKEALIRVLPNLEPKILDELYTHLIMSTQGIDQLLTKEKRERSDLTEEFLEKLRTLERSETHKIWVTTEELDREDEGPKLDDLLKKIDN